MKSARAPVTHATAPSAVFVSVVEADCTGRAVRKLSCPFDVEALKPLNPSVRRAQAVLSH